MCGINGFNFKDERLIQAMNQVTCHRGPDQTAIFCDDGISLGFNRLAIIDLSERGSQPMWDSEHKVVITFNGEIYNYQELRKTLLAKYTFHSESDTEVILNAYKEYGLDFVKKLNGMFAIAIWDTRTKKLVLARDPMGIKPLYYYHEDNKFIYSSEIKAVLEHPIKREVDMVAFNQYFQLLYVPAPRTMFKNIYKLLPGHMLVVDGSTVTNTQFYEPTTATVNETASQAKKTIRALFDDSVKRQLVSDRPVGVFLSGGIDSTAVLGAAAKFHEGAIKTFSVAFKDSVQSEKFNADAELAKKTAAVYKTDHTELQIGPEDFAKELKNIAWHMDEPNANPTAGAMLLLSRLAKQSVAVVLGGDGGDELFGGYPRYHLSARISLFQKLPKVVQAFFKACFSFFGFSKLVTKLSIPPGAKRVVTFLSQKENTLEKIILPNVFLPKASEQYFEERFSNRLSRKTDFEKLFMQADRESWLVDESLLRSDKMTMAAGLEARVPILDLPLVKYAESLPTKLKLRPLQNLFGSFTGKNIWRDAVADYLPKFVANQEKRGWFTPMAKWLRHPALMPEIEQILAPDKLPKGYFNAENVSILLRDHINYKRYNLAIIWAIVMWCLWYDKFIKEEV